MTLTINQGSPISNRCVRLAGFLFTDGHTDRHPMNIQTLLGFVEVLTYSIKRTQTHPRPSIELKLFSQTT